MKRTNTAKWIESACRWQINVQKDGVRKTFTSAKPGRTGQREANKKADDWLEKGLQTQDLCRRGGLFGVHGPTEESILRGKLEAHAGPL